MQDNARNATETSCPKDTALPEQYLPEVCFPLVLNKMY